jgi:hypothetical protein
MLVPPCCRPDTTGVLVELLVADLDRAALAALVLEEAEDSSCQNGEHEYVACGEVSSAALRGLQCDIPTRNETMPPARSTRPLKKLMTSSTISVANLAANWAVFWTRWPAVVKKDQMSSTNEDTTSERALTIEDMLVDVGSGS